LPFTPALSPSEGEREGIATRQSKSNIAVMSVDLGCVHLHEIVHQSFALDLL
jgi:hypothetical protein